MPWSNLAVKRNARLVAYVYGTWCAVLIAVAVLNIGDGGVGSHLALAFTGMPASLLSLYLPNGSVLATIVAAVLGFAQWVAIVAWWSTDEPVNVKNDV
jgi:hypothetical protein